MTQEAENHGSKEKNDEPLPSWVTKERQAIMALLYYSEMTTTTKKAIVMGLETRTQQKAFLDWMLKEHPKAPPKQDEALLKMCSIQRTVS